jgi:signal transduction histidine kinase
MEVIESANRAKDLVRQILTFSRQSEQECFPVDLSPIVKEALKQMRASLPTTVEIRPEIQADCGNVLADPSQMHQVLLNLCTNASHAMKETGGVLTVRLKSYNVIECDPLAPAQLNPGRYVRLTVADTRMGMDQPTMDRIFEPFFTTKQVGEGTGQGLSVVHGIISKIRGSDYRA